MKKLQEESYEQLIPLPPFFKLKFKGWKDIISHSIAINLVVMGVIEIRLSVLLQWLLYFAFGNVLQFEEVRKPQAVGYTFGETCPATGL